MRKINEYINEKAEVLDLERGSQLAAIQERLNSLYPGKVRAKRLNDGELTITTPSAAVAGDLRMGQVSLKASLEGYGVKKLRITIN